MSLKCSVLGHTYGDTEVEREREEQGSEVVITIRETERCRRCGKARIVSENKEVTTIETASGAGDVAADAATGDDAPAGEVAADETAGGQGGVTVGPDADAESSGGVGVDAEATAGVDAEATAGVDAGGDVETAGSGASAGTGAHTGAANDPDSAEILVAETEDPVDDELADPSVGDAGTEIDQGHAGVGTASGDGDDGGDGEDAVIIENDEPEPTADRDEEGRAPGEWPEEPADEDPEWQPETALDEPEVQTDTSTAVTVPEGQFHCPECGFATDVEDSSLRAGDFCPSCRTGSLEHRRD